MVRRMSTRFSAHELKVSFDMVTRFSNQDANFQFLLKSQDLNQNFLGSIQGLYAKSIATELNLFDIQSTQYNLMQ